MVIIKKQILGILFINYMFCLAVHQDEALHLPQLQRKKDF